MELYQNKSSVNFQYQKSSDYTATLAHKINHSFDPNSEFVSAQHPCYGRIPAVRTIRRVAKGEELLAHYGMDMETAFDWYQEAWRIHSANLEQG